MTTGESMRQTTGIDRRGFLRRGALASGLAVSVPFHALLARAETSSATAGGRGKGRPERATSPDYGPLQAVKDETTGLPLLLAPAGFRYLTYGWTRDPLRDGTLTPALHDGMAALPADGGRVRLVRNHEVAVGDAFTPTLAYDPKGGGGTTTVEFDPHRGQFVESWSSLSGTVRNCAGGPTPWGTWLSCEESVVEPETEPDLGEKHGYIFEVPTEGHADPVPLKAMGRFVHEAVAVDAETGIVYETEDARASGFYRYTPKEPGRPAAGGTLHMLAIAGRPQYDTRGGQQQDQPFDVEWVPIDRPDPDLAHEATVYQQGRARGGATFARLEGAWYGDGHVYFVSTNGGDAEQGQIWDYEPATERLRLLFESPSAEVLNMPDNICVTPRGGLLLCEDGSDTQYIHGLTVDGEIFRFVQNNVHLAGERNGLSGDFRGSELAGVTVSPDGQWLFFNIQNPGITVAMTGPWAAGAL